VVYDNIDLLNIYGEISTNPSKKLGFILKGNYNKFIYLENELKAWHKPEYEISLSSRYNLKDKILINADFFAQGKRYAKSFNTDVKYYTLKEIIDLNLGVEYRYTNILSAFIKFNNLTSSKYQKWNFYPSQRFNVMVGFSYSM
jgi:outer membrane receptor protein involved in Fe transport